MLQVDLQVLVDNCYMRLPLLFYLPSAVFIYLEFDMTRI